MDQARPWTPGRTLVEGDRETCRPWRYGVGALQEGSKGRYSGQTCRRCQVKTRTRRGQLPPGSTIWGGRVQVLSWGFFRTLFARNEQQLHQFYPAGLPWSGPNKAPSAGRDPSTEAKAPLEWAYLASSRRTGHNFTTKTRRMTMSKLFNLRERIEKETDWDILEYVARRSPKEYADRIFERNRAAWRVLKDREYGTNDDDASESRVPHGCPHCTFENSNTKCGMYKCGSCLWMEAWNIFHPPDPAVDAGGGIWTGDNSVVCINVYFGGIAHSTVPSVCYCHNCVHVYGPGTSQDYFDTVTFLVGHMVWARKPYWGTEL